MTIKEDPMAICKDIERLQPEMKIAIAQLAKVHDFRVTETYRSPERQAMLKATGKSKTLNSRHRLGLAVDIYPLPDGYQTSAEVFAKIHGDWRRIASDVGYPKTSVLEWDKCHLSLNDGRSI